MEISAEKLEESYQESILHLKHGRIQQAQETLKDLLNSLPNNPIVLERVGYTYALQEKWGDAEGYFRKAILQAPQNAEILNNLGCILIKQEKWREAATYFSQAVNENPKNLAALGNLALCLHKDQNYPLAIEKYKQLLTAQPNNTSVLFNLGELYFHSDDLTEAENYYLKVIKLSDEHIQARIMLALCLFARGAESEAIDLVKDIPNDNHSLEYSLSLFADTAKAQQNFSYAYYGYGLLYALHPEKADIRKAYALNLYMSGGDIDTVAKLLKDGMTEFPNDPVFPQTLSLAYGQVGRTKEALDAAEIFVQRAPHDIKAHVSFANLHLQYQKLQSSELTDLETPTASYMKALEICDKDLDVTIKIAQCLIETKEPPIVRACLKASEAHDAHPIFANILSGYIALCDKDFQHAKVNFLAAKEIAPDSSFILSELADVLYNLYEVDDALDVSRRSIALAPNNSQSMQRHGILLNNCGFQEEGLAANIRAVEINPRDPDLQFSLGLQYLIRGEWQKGWQLYDNRFKFRYRNPIQIPPVPRWDGSPLQDGELIVCSEQGLGDIIQFARFVPQLTSLAQRVFFVARPSILHLFQHFCDEFPNIELIPEGENFSVSRSRSKWCPVMDLPNLLNLSESEWGKYVPYIKTQDEKITDWQNRLGSKGIKVGIVWQGNPDHTVDLGRSIPLKYYEPLSQIDNVRLICLQKLHGLEQLDEINFADKIEQLGEDFDEGGKAFEDTIHAMHALDLIVTSDTSIAHIAGALGRPVWLGIKFASEWRWQLKREDNPWYPSMRIFRQKSIGDWPSVMAAIADNLKHLAQGDKTVLQAKKYKE